MKLSCLGGVLATLLPTVEPSGGCLQQRRAQAPLETVVNLLSLSKVSNHKCVSVSVCVSASNDGISQGFAYVGGACVVNKRLEKVNSVAIVEDTGGFSGIIVAAHEVGHL